MSVEFFRTSLELLHRITLAADIDMQDRASRLNAFGCVMVRGEWQPSPAVVAAACELHAAADPVLNHLSESRREASTVPGENQALEKAGELAPRTEPSVRTFARSRATSRVAGAAAAPPPADVPFRRGLTDRRFTATQHAAIVPMGGICG